jgi:hypothetical protein
MAQNRHFSFVSTKALALAFQETFRTKYLDLCWLKTEGYSFSRNAYAVRIARRLEMSRP